MHLVPGNRERMAPNALHIDSDFPRCLYSVGVETNTCLRCDLSDRVDWLQYSGFVVRHHDGNQLRIPTQRPANVIRIHLPAAVDWQDRHLTRPFSEVLAGMEHRMMLYA